jgi:hypothetical protein
MAVSEADTAAESPADLRNARLYLTGLRCSVIGSMSLSLVAGIWVKSLTESSSEAGLVSACVYRRRCSARWPGWLPTGWRGGAPGSRKSG